jgi:uncharacterized repeat protein (TIGR01451 family)
MRISPRPAAVILLAAVLSLASRGTAKADSADLSILKAGAPDPVAPGGTLVYSMTVNNEGPDDAVSAVLDDPLPAGTTFQSLASPAGWSCSTPAAGSGGTVSCSAATFPVGSAAFTIEVQVGASVAAGTVLDNTATLSSATPDPAPGDESATTFTTVGSTPAGLSMTIADAPDPVVAGFDVTYTITVSTTITDGTNAVLSFPLPPGTTFRSLAPQAGWICPAPAVPGSYPTFCQISALPAGDSVFALTVRVPASAAAGSTVTDTASFAVETDGRTAVAADSEDTLVVAATVLSGSKTASGRLQPGGTVTYTIVLANAGPGAQADNPGDELVDVLPPELTLIAASATSGTAVATPATSTVTWNGAIPASGSVTVTIQAAIGAGLPSGAVISNQAAFSYDADGDGTNESTGVTDDPGTPGAGDPTVVLLASVVDVPALHVPGAALLAALLAVAGAAAAARIGHRRSP